MAGGGVGEAMLISAAVGAGTGAAGSAIQGGDPLKGALMGGVTGAIGGGVMGAMAPAAGATAGGMGGAGAGATSGAAAGAVPGATTGMGTGTLSGTAATLPSLSAQVPTIGAGAGMGSGTGIGSSAGASLGANAVPPVSPNAFGFSNLTNTQLGMIGAGSGISAAIQADQQRYGIPDSLNAPYSGPLSKFKYDPNKFKPSTAPGYASGGITDLDTYASNSTNPSGYLKQPVMMMASGGIASLGSYSDGGRLLKGPGDGMSDNIPARIGAKQPARLADGEFVVPADVVSHLGNGSTDAGAKQLYAMLDKVRAARTGNPKQGKQINPRKYVPV